MIRSMTGFGRSAFTTRDARFDVEVRSVNHRYLELNPRLPEELRAIEPALLERAPGHRVACHLDLA